MNAARKFSAKLGRHRCVIVRRRTIVKMRMTVCGRTLRLVKRALDDAGAPDHDGLVSFKELRGQVLHELKASGPVRRRAFTFISEAYGPGEGRAGPASSRC